MIPPMPPPSEVAVTAPFAGTVSAIAHEPPEPVRAGAAVVVLEAMKMEHEVVAEADGVVRRVEVAVGDTVDEGQLLAVLAPGEASATTRDETEAVDLNTIRDDLAAVGERHAIRLDGARPDPVPRRHEGGRRPGDVDWPMVAGLDCRAFLLFGRLSGLVPLVGLGSGYCFAGNAALLGSCDVVIATEDSSIGMGGPAMIEGGGLGVHDPGEVGPIEVQHANGVVDLRVADERAAVAAAKRYLSYFRGRAAETATLPHQRALRHLIPEQRKRLHDLRAGGDRP